MIINGACNGGGSTRFKNVPKQMNIKLFTGDSIDDVKHVASMGRFNKPSPKLLDPPVNNMQMRPTFSSQSSQSSIQQHIDSGNDKIRELQEELKAVYQVNGIKEEEICNLRIKLKKHERMLQNALNTFGSICHYCLNNDIPFNLPEFLFVGPGGSKMKTIHAIYSARHLDEQRNAQRAFNPALADPQPVINQQKSSVIQQLVEGEIEDEDQDALIDNDDLKQVVDDSQRETESNVVEMKADGDGELNQNDVDAGFYDPGFLSDEILATMYLPSGAVNAQINVANDQEDDEQMMCID